MQNKTISVFLSARKPTKTNKMIIERAASYLVQEGYTMYYGGGYSGGMGVFARAVEALGGNIQGVTTHHLLRTEGQDSNPDTTFVVESMGERKSQQLSRSMNVLVLPGGFGTLDELFEAVTLNQLGLIHSKIFVWNRTFREFLEPMFQRMRGVGVVNDSDIRRIVFVDDIDELRKYL